MAIHKIFFGLILCCCLGACGKWIDVKPSDRLAEDVLFADRDGFLKALNGVYVEMTNNALYGREMTMGAMDVLGQYYDMRQSTHVYARYAAFEYTQEKPKATFDAAWRKAYELIANCNIILEQCGETPSEILPEPYYSLIKGEALALRALLHFDMLRLFGPIWSESNKSAISIPYVTEAGFDIPPLLSTEAVMQHVIADLNAALSLLETVDPVRTAGVRNGSNPNGPNDFYYRQYRLNYYATKALLARAYLWQGNKASALQYAQEILAEAQTSENAIFPFVSFANAVDPEHPDRVFSTEVLFALYDVNRVKTYDALFATPLKPTERLSFDATGTDMARVEELYDDDNDYRKRIWQKRTSEADERLTNVKYEDVEDAPGRYMIPMIRLSEVLLIAAECSSTLEEGTTYLNQLRTNRNCFDLAPADETALKTAIAREFRKEVIGEGQQFFYYKRNAMEIIPHSRQLLGNQVMVLTNYVVPLPDSEIEQRVNLN